MNAWTAECAVGLAGRYASLVPGQAVQQNPARWAAQIGLGLDSCQEVEL